MSVRAPSSRTHRPSPRARSRLARLSVGRSCLCLALLLLAACSPGLAVDTTEADSGPCGRGKARSCQCDNGQRGIAQCLVGGDWGACWCGEGEPLSSDAGVIDWTRDARISTTDDLNVPKSIECELPIDLRAHAAGHRSEPFLVNGGGLLGGASESDQAMCFFFKLPPDSALSALSFLPLGDEVSRPQRWLLHGIDSSARADGDVFPCNASEPGAYPLAGFAQGSNDMLMPDDVALALPTGAKAGIILEVHYDAGPTELLDRTGIRICAGGPVEREHTATVHITGSEAICIPPGSTNFDVTGVCAPRVDQGDIHLLSVWPQLHRQGRHVRVTLQRKDGVQETLLDQPYLSGSLAYELAGDVVLKPGDRLETRCTYDNPGLFSVPYGSLASDETCYAFVTAWPPGALSVEPSGLDPLRTLSFGTDPTRRCLDPLSVLGSCNGPADVY